MPLWVIALAIAAVALVLGWLSHRRRLRPLPQADALGTDERTKWKVTVILLACEIAGVAASFYLTQATLRPGQNVFVLSCIIAAANFAGALQGRGGLDQPLNPTELFAFFKDGLLWPTALPVIAETLQSAPPAG
jgi:hypothetical protein